MFDPKTWQCAKCGRTGTLCSKMINVTVLHSVAHVGNNIVLGGLEHKYGKFDGYVCSKCGMRVADTDEELIKRFK
jgi:DNA-directed RNA polymerase subunit RPC12/RpoP